MQVTLLGTGQLHPADRVQCGTLVEDLPALIDSGAGVYQRIHESTISVDDLQHVMFTHLHQDHVNDIVPIISAKRFTNDRPFPDAPGRRDDFRDGPSRLTIYGPPGTERFMKLLIRAHVKSQDSESEIELPFRDDKIDLSVEEITPGSTFSIDDQTIATRETDHISEEEPTLAYKFDKELVVSGDTPADESIADFADGVRVLIHECTFFDGRDASGHTTPRDLARILEGRDIDEVYLTHLPDHTSQERRRVIATIQDRFDGNVTVTRDLERISTR